MTGSRDCGNISIERSFDNPPINIMHKEETEEAKHSQGSKKELIREAATRVFAERGFHSTNMPAIAQEAGVAIGTIYHYFEGKKEILIYIFQKEIEQRKRFFDDLSSSGLSRWDKIRDMLEMHFRRARERKNLTRVLLMEMLAPEEKLREELKKLRDDMAGYISEIIEDGIKKKEVVPCDADIIAHGLFGMIVSVTTRGVLYDDRQAENILDKAPTELAVSIERWLKNNEGG